VEGKLAETAPKKPLALTLGAAAVTLLVVLGVVSGPSVLDCFNSGRGMGQCLQGKLADAGILPAPSPAAVAEVPPPAAPAPEAPTELGEPALDVAGDVPADIPDNLISATFGLLRAEPDGSVVIAGSGTPGAEVEIYENDDLLGKTTVESSGDWVLVPERPIAPGGAEITLAEAGKPGRAEQSFVVVINDDKSSEPLVVASTPGAISQVLQGLTAPAEAPTQLAAADPVAPPAAPQPAATPQPAPAPQAEPAAPEPAPAAAAEPAAQPAPAPQPAAAPPAAPADTAAHPAPAEPAPVPVEPAPAAPQPEPAAPATPEPAAPVPAPAPPAPDAPVPQPPTPALEAPVATPAPVEVAAAPAQAEPVPAPTPVPAPAVAAPMVQPTIDAIEVEGDRAFFAGAGAEGATIRLYVEDGFVADTTVAEGRWLIEAGKVLTRPQQRVRIDMLQPGSGSVTARAEVDFVLDLPVETPPVAIADAPEATAAGETPASAPQAGSSAPAAVETPAPAAQPAPSASSTPAEQPAAAPVPTLVAVSVGGGDAQRFASGKAIIRRGDNLWTIARRVYGEGFKYTTIYQANTGQIRDPDLIYPGQVFDLPN